MANKEISDLNPVTTNVSGDLVLVKRGTGADSDKKQTKDTLLTNWPFAVSFNGTGSFDGNVTVGDWTGGSTPATTANNLVIREDGNAGLTIMTNASSTGRINFADPGSADVGRIQYQHSDNSLGFFTNSTEALRIDSNGSLDILQSGQGLSFAGGTVLSDYVGMTAFTPDLNFGGSEISTDGGGYDRRTGYYMRLGDLVFLFIRIELNAKGNHTGAATITGMPVGESTTGNVNGGMFFSRMDDLSYSGEPHAWVQTSVVNLYETTSGNSRTTITDADFENATDIELWGMYFAS